ncbi:calcium-binding and coiled-coil domain-containing protein 2 isoform 2-T2 [Aulostomus maculatus]
MEAATPDPAVRTYTQVVFTDVPHSYTPATPVTCCYTLPAGFEPHPRDWVGIFQVGWSTTKDYHTFVWAEPCSEEVGLQSVAMSAIFKEYYLPKDETEFYQFCYIDGGGQVRGASTPFCFRELVEMSEESGPDDDLLVITTQEQVEQSVREKAELMREVDRVREENERLNSVLQEEEQEAATLKEHQKEKEKEMSELVEELHRLKEENENLKSNLEEQRQETQHLKDELEVQTAKQQLNEQIQQQSQSVNGASRQDEAKYERAVTKINQLKEERQQLRTTISVQSDEIAKLNSKLREGERELFKLRDNAQLLQVDLQSSKKEKERLSAELQLLQSLTHTLDEVKLENRELSRRLTQEETQTSSDEDLKVEYQTVLSQLEGTRVQLATEREESKTTHQRAEVLDREMQQLKTTLEEVAALYKQEQQKSSKQELQLREVHKMVADSNIIIEEKEHMVSLVQREVEELTRENQKLRSDIEGLRSHSSDLKTVPLADLGHPDAARPAGATSRSHREQPREPAQLSEHIYDNISRISEPEEEPLVCHHCLESFPGITPQELEQHEQSHQVCPFCLMVFDNVEQSVFEDHVYSH